jgi:alpha-L-fucosidase 2
MRHLFFAGMLFFYQFLATFFAAEAPMADGTKTLWFNKPASAWTEALPIGNGRLGAMIFGGAATETIQINEDTLWSGGPKDWNNPHAKEVLPLVRKAVFAKNYREADRLCQQMQGPYTQSYLPMGNLQFRFAHDKEIANYRRVLDLDKALATVDYEAQGVKYHREIFSSNPDQVIIIRLTSNRPGSLTFSVQMESLLRFSIQPV